MKCLSDLTGKSKFIQVVFTMAVIFINIVIAPYSGYRLPPKEVNNSSEIRSSISNFPSNHGTDLTYEDLYPNKNLNMSKETQETIYADILHIINDAKRSIAGRKTKQGDYTKETKQGVNNSKKIVPSDNSTNSHKNVNNVISKSHSVSPNFYSNVLNLWDSEKEALSSENEIMVDGEKSSKKKEIRVNDLVDVSKSIGGSANSDYLLGYSSNIFGSHTEYIEHMSDDSEVPKYVEQLPTGKSENSTTHQSKRKKRSVVHLYNMVLCATGCNPLSYKGYGCYCGFLGSGYVVDGIDSCCKMHDWCYDTAGCPMFLEYFIPYLWKCYHHRPLCAIDHGGYGGPGSCAQRLCECDRQLAQCLRRYPCPSTKALCTSSPWRLLQNIFML